jgi:hypothetical protein
MEKNHQQQSADANAPGHDLGGGEVLQGDLDEEERGAPDRSEEDEARGV